MGKLQTTQQKSLYKRFINCLVGIGKFHEKAFYYLSHFLPALQSGICLQTICGLFVHWLRKYMCFTVLLIAVSLQSCKLNVNTLINVCHLLAVDFKKGAKGFNIFVLSHTFYTTKEIKATSIKRKVTKALAFSLRVAGAGCKQAFFFYVMRKIRLWSMNTVFPWIFKMIRWPCVLIKLVFFFNHVTWLRQSGKWNQIQTVCWPTLIS